VVSQNDRDILKELAKIYMEAASAPRNAENVNLWKELNCGKMARPMVSVAVRPPETDENMQCKVEDPYWREVERSLRRRLYIWQQSPADMVIEPFIKIPMSVTDSGYGIQTTGENDSGALRYRPFVDENMDLSIITSRTFKHESTETRRHFIEGEDMFSGIAPIRVHGVTFKLGIWEEITAWLGMEQCYTMLKDHPDFVHKLLRKMTNALTAGIRQVNTMRISNDFANTCNGSYVYDDKFLPIPGKGKGAVTSNSWASGMAQIFASMSPELTKEFEIPYFRELAWEFGSVYYGGEEVFHDRLDILKKVPNIRKLSCSPRNDRALFFEAVPSNIVVSVKPSLALLSASPLDEAAIRKEIEDACALAKTHGKKLEFILKDIPANLNRPDIIGRWSQIAMEVVKSW